MALRLWCAGSGASLCGEKRSAGDRLHLTIGPKSRWAAAGGMLPATAIPVHPRAVVCCSTHVDRACDGKGRVIRHQAVNLRPCGYGPYDVDNEEAEKKRGGGRAAESSEKVDRWMQECIVEIVRNIGEAPFLVYVFFCNDDCTRGGRAALKLEMEAADPESWPAIKGRWDRGVATPPHGVILVEALQRDSDGGITRTKKDLTTWDGGEEESVSSSSSSTTWGVLVQEWGCVDCAGCYILNTCRVRSAFGFCTHFCLTRARCFEDTADVQLKKLWLVGGTQQQQHHSHHRWPQR